MTNRFSLDHLRALSVSGPDALTFANAQLTVAAASLPRDQWRPTAWCDPKGRVLATMMARAGENDVELVLSAELSETVGKRLEMFTIGRDVRISSPLRISGAFMPANDVPSLVIDPQRGMRIDENAQADRQALERWRQLDLCAGWSWLSPATSGEFLPQFLGLEAAGALAFDKGCYPGQEVIARLHYRGTSKYALRGLAWGEAFDPPAAARLSDEAGKRVGSLLESMIADGGRIGLAVVSTAIEPGATVVVNEGDEAMGRARVTAPKALC